MSKTQVPVAAKAIISAKVFRAYKRKPRLVPGFLWFIALRKKWSLAGRWEDLGVIGTMHETAV